MLLGTENAAWNELENVFFLADDDSVACIVAASDTDNIIKRAGKIIDNLAFAFVTPLRANDDDRFHPLYLSVPTPFPYASE